MCSQPVRCVKPHSPLAFIFLCVLMSPIVVLACFVQAFGWVQSLFEEDRSWEQLQETDSL